MLTLASSHALTSRMTPELGRGGRDGGWIEVVYISRWKVIGIGGTAGTSSTALDGARLVVRRSRSPPSPSQVGWIDGSFRRRFWIHCFAASCLPVDAEDVLVVGVVILAVLEGPVRIESTR